jgi:hypothetical protein
VRPLQKRIMLDVMFDSRVVTILPDHVNRAVVEGKRTPLVRKRQDKDAYRHYAVNDFRSAGFRVSFQAVSLFQPDLLCP